MTVLTPNLPAATADPLLTVEASQAAPLTPGTHQVRLVVVDSDGNQSEPAVISVTIQPPPPPHS
jgi:hypothetical protein